MAILRTDASGLALTDNSGNPLVKTTGSVLQTRSNTSYSSSSTTNVGGFGRNATVNWVQFLTCQLTINKQTSTALILGSAFAIARRFNLNSPTTTNIRTKIMRRRSQGEWTDVAPGTGDYTGLARWNPKTPTASYTGGSADGNTYLAGGMLSYLIMDPTPASQDSQNVEYAIWFTSDNSLTQTWMGSGDIEDPNTLCTLTVIEFASNISSSYSWTANTIYP